MSSKKEKARAKALDQRIKEAYRRAHPEATSLFGNRAWFARQCRVHPTTVDKWLRGVHPPGRGEAMLDQLERQD